MKAQELIAKLQAYPPDTEVMLLEHDDIEEWASPDICVEEDEVWYRPSPFDWYQRHCDLYDVPAQDRTKVLILS